MNIITPELLTNFLTCILLSAVITTLSSLLRSGKRSKRFYMIVDILIVVITVIAAGAYAYFGVIDDIRYLLLLTGVMMLITAIVALHMGVKMLHENKMKKNERMK